MHCVLQAHLAYERYSKVDNKLYLLLENIQAMLNGIQTVTTQTCTSEFKA